MFIPQRIANSATINLVSFLIRYIYKITADKHIIKINVFRFIFKDISNVKKHKTIPSITIAFIDSLYTTDPLRV